jgi:hypothetical protein
VHKKPEPKAKKEQSGKMPLAALIIAFKRKKK